MDVYVNDAEKRLYDFGFGFTGFHRMKPDEGLVQLLELDSTAFRVREEEGYLVCRPLDRMAEDYAGYVRACMGYFGMTTCGSSSCGNLQWGESIKGPEDL